MKCRRVVCDNTRAREVVLPGTPPPAAPAFGNMSTYKRREMRNAKTPHGAKGGKRRQGEPEEGEMSDGASSVASKLARGVRGMHAHDEGDLR